MTARVAAVLIAVLLLVPAPVAAQSSQAPPPAQEAVYNAPDDGFDNYVSAYYNFNFGGSLFQELSDLDGHSSSQGFGAALTFWGRGKFSAELDFNYNPSFFGSESDAGSNNLLTFTFSGIIGPWINQGGSQRIRPYVVFGGGLMRSTIEEFATVGWKSTKNLGVVDVGGGLIYFFHPRVGIRGDVRYRFGIGANDSEDGWGMLTDWNYWRGSIGASFAF